MMRTLGKIFKGNHNRDSKKYVVYIYCYLCVISLFVFIYLLKQISAPTETELDVHIVEVDDCTHETIILLTDEGITYPVPLNNLEMSLEVIDILPFTATLRTLGMDVTTINIH